MIAVARKALLGRKLRAILTGLAIVLGVATISLTLPAFSPGGSLPPRP
jgi:hypothetical protein